jgi:NAD(P)-dependent dehydrogenase (short-subunit alcohol dehydrogenase family)
MGQQLIQRTDRVIELGKCVIADRDLRRNRQIRSHRGQRPEEIAGVVAFLASEKASFIVGAVVMADGEMSVAIPSQ